MSGVTKATGRGAVAASILGAALLGGYLAASPGGLRPSPLAYLVHAAVLALAFWFPAMKIGAPGDVLRSWRSLFPWILGWALVWDLATAGLTARGLFQHWWLVYPAAVLLLTALLLLHGTAVRWRGSRSNPIER